jgi:hypothetical protein
VKGVFLFGQFILFIFYTLNLDPAPVASKGVGLTKNKLSIIMRPASAGGFQIAGLVKFFHK